MPRSAVTFPTQSRIHIAIAVRDLDASVNFYSTLFDQAPTKRRVDYAKFEVVEPPVNFTLNQHDGALGSPPPLQHFGVQVQDTDVLAALHARATGAGLAAVTEDAKTCCYAVADKVWLEDPNGHKWELFVVLDADADVHSIPTPAVASQDAQDSEIAPAACCEPTCCK